MNEEKTIINIVKVKEEQVENYYYNYEYKENNIQQVIIKQEEVECDFEYEKRGENLEKINDPFEECKKEITEEYECSEVSCNESDSQDNEEEKIVQIDNREDKLFLFTCDLCSYSHKHKSRVTRHRLSHSDDKRFICDECDFSTIHKGSLKQHKLKHNKEKVVNYKCNQCDYSTVYKSSLKFHSLKVHNKDNAVMHHCDLCDFTSIYKRSVKDHQRMHSNCRPFSCDRCDYKSKSKAVLMKHMLTHTRDRLLQCDYCHFTTIHRKSIKSHLLIHSNDSVGNKTYTSTCKKKSIVADSARQSVADHEVKH